jgi:hypothetical protein
MNARLDPFLKTISALGLAASLGCAGCAHRDSASTSPTTAVPATGQAGVIETSATAAVSAPAPAVAPPPSNAALAPVQLEGTDWTLLFDGQTLQGWKITDFAGHGEVAVENGELRIGMGAMLSGVTLTNQPPGLDYELAFDVMKTEGSDFFCGLTAPYAETNFTLIMGGWGGGLVGISSIDGGDASSNDTTKFMRFEANQWYKVRLKVTRPRLEAWIDDQKIIDADVRERSISLRPGEIEIAVPLSLSTYQTGAAYRDIRIRRLASP